MKIITGDINLYKVGLNTLPQLEDVVIKGQFDCSDNHLTNLKGCPIEIGRSFLCSKNKLTNLQYGPQKVGESYLVDDNQLISLNGCPEFINGAFDCSNNNLKTLEGCPKHVNGDFYCFGNTEYFSYDYIRSMCSVDGSIYNGIKGQGRL